MYEHNHQCNSSGGQLRSLLPKNATSNGAAAAAAAAERCSSSKKRANEDTEGEDSSTERPGAKKIKTEKAAVTEVLFEVPDWD